MRVPLSWLKEYVTYEQSPEQLAERLTLGGLEVTAIDRVGENWDRSKILIGQVRTVRPHPNADRLTLVSVDYGREEPLEVVTGAPNLHVGDSGQKVVLALAGARLIDPYAEGIRYKTLKPSKIRGVRSEGMVCSEKELGISDEHTGILILPDDAPVGIPFADYWGDVVLDLDLTPNLARCLSILGVARETAALTGGKLHAPKWTLRAEGEPIDGQINIEIADPDLCPRYSAALIKGISIGPSPQWMQRRLILAGMRPINNIVDITNYVMLELGQPLHAFDYDRLRPRTAGEAPVIIVRRAHPGETMTTLDGQERHFTKDMLLITDGGGPVAIAGVMGGLESEVTESTVNILLESANFDYISIRRTAMALKIPSEAVQRFSRGVDPELTLEALKRAAELMRELGGGTVAQGFADVYPGRQAPRVIDFPVSEVRRLLGIDLSPKEIVQILMSLGFECEIVGLEAPIIRTTVPSFRQDVSIPADLVEEVARIYGYDRLPSTLILDEMPHQRRDLDLELEERVRDALVGCGLTEIITYSLTNLESVANLRPDQQPPDAGTFLRVTNPQSREHEYLRQTLMNTTLETIARNLRFTDRVLVFEIAHVYLPQPDRMLPKEPRRLSIGLTGPRDARSWLTEQKAHLDFYDLKGIVEILGERLGIQNLGTSPTEHPTFRPGRCASIDIADERIGVFGEVHPLVCESFDLEGHQVCLLELDLDRLLAAAEPTKRFSPVSRMPALKLDLSIIVDESVPSDALAQAIHKAGQPLLVSMVLFDVYRGPQIGEGKKSLTYSLTFQAPDRTLTSQQANKQRDRIVRQLEKEFGAQLRA